MICEYGCGQEGKHQLKNGKWCCSPSVNSCKARKDNLSKKFVGKNNPFYGKHHSNKTKHILKDVNIGKSLSENTKKKISISSKRKRKPLSESHKQKLRQSKLGSIPWNKWKVDCYSDETKRIWFTQRYRDRNHQWKGGISFEPYCEQWLDKDYKESIKERDGYKCLNPSCSKTTEKLCIHHIDYNKKNCHPLNLITVCISCNAKANKDRQWHKSWYKAIIYRRYND